MPGFPSIWRKTQNGKRIVEKCILAMNAREAARKARI